MTYIIGLEKGQLHVRTPQNNVYHVGIHNEPSLEQIFTKHGLPEACVYSSSTDFPEEYGVPKDYNARAVITRVAQGMGMRVKPKSLSKLFDECFLDRARLLEAQGKDPFMSEIRELALAEFIRRISIEQGNTTKPEHMKQDTPPEQAVAILGGIEGWLSNLLDGTSQPERAAEGIQRGLEDLKILCGTRRGQPDGWLRKTW